MDWPERTGCLAATVGFLNRLDKIFSAPIKFVLFEFLVFN